MDGISEVDYCKLDSQQLHYASAWPVIEAICRSISIESVVEVGTGYYSTPHWSRYAKEMVSIETAPFWYQKIRSLYPSISLILTTDELKTLSEVPVGNILFIDGTNESRLACVQYGVSYYDITVWHDANALQVGQTIGIFGFCCAPCGTTGFYTKSIHDFMKICEALQITLLEWTTMVSESSL